MYHYKFVILYEKNWSGLHNHQIFQFVTKPSKPNWLGNIWMFPGILVTRKYLMFAAAKEDNGKKEHYFVGNLTNSRAQMAKMLRVTLLTLSYLCLYVWTERRGSWSIILDLETRKSWVKWTNPGHSLESLKLQNLIYFLAVFSFKSRHTQICLLRGIYYLYFTD